MNVHILGCGDAFSAKWYSTCFLVETEGTRILVDCPHPIRKILHESTAATVDIGDIDAVVLTHLHADHASGLEGFAYFSHFLLQKRVQLIIHERVLKDLWPHSLRAGMSCLLRHPEGGDGGDAPALCEHKMSMADFFNVRLIDEDNPVQVGDLTLTCRQTIHHVPTYAFRFTDVHDKTLAYSADTAFDPALIDWLAREANVIVHETNYGAHTPYAKLAGLERSVRNRMRLIHYPDDFDISASEIPCVTPGERIEI